MKFQYARFHLYDQCDISWQMFGEGSPFNLMITICGIQQSLNNIQSKTAYHYNMSQIWLQQYF